jgi:hypothetical protein
MKEAINLHRIKRNCGHCRYGKLESGTFSCKRPNGFGCDSGDFLWWSMVCDGFKEMKDMRF